MPKTVHLASWFAIIALSVLETSSAAHGVIAGWRATDQKALTTMPLRLRGGASGYSLGLRDSIMIAHSFKGQEFGPAQSMHGATYTVDVEFHVKNLVLE
jgi:hypothetical protein